MVSPFDGTVTWTDTRIVNGNIAPPGKGQLHFSADINCPGEGVFKLDGEAGTAGESTASSGGEVHLEKVDNPFFTPSVPFTADPPVVKAPASTAPLPARKVAIADPAPPTGPAVIPNGTMRAPTSIEDKFLQRQKNAGSGISPFR